MPRAFISTLRRYCVAYSAGLIALSALPAHAATDFNKWAAGQVPVGQTNAADGLDDIWQSLYNAWALDPAGDNDKDGTSNASESIAGTNPFQRDDYLRVGKTEVATNNMVFTFDAKAGKKYRILSSDSLTGAFTTAENLQAPASGQEFIPTADNATQTLSVAKSGNSRKFYKLETSDVEIDGVSHWAKRKLGLDPTKADTNGDGLSDYAEISQELQIPDVVTIGTNKAFASEDGPESSSFTVTRKRKMLPVTVNYTMGGSASPGSDYNRSPMAAVTFAAGVQTATISVNVLTDAAVEGSEAITATLTTTSTDTALPGPAIGTPGSATIIVNNSAAATGTGLLARYYDNFSSTANSALNFGDNANYAYTRSGTSPNFTGVVVVTPTGLTAQRLADLLAAMTLNTTQVKLSFTGGNLNIPTYNHLGYLVTAKTASTFTCSLPPGISLPASSSSTCGFSILPSSPAVVERIDPTINFDWQYGTPNGVGITPNNPVDNYSATWEAYLQPTTAGAHFFQLDADDKARVLLDLNNNGTFDLPGEQIVEHGWDTSATGSPDDGVADNETIGTFKQSASITLAVPATPAERLKIRVEMVEFTGDARCRLQWRTPTAGYANIPQANVFTHTQAATYAFTRTNTTTGTATITLTGHGLVQNDPVKIAFSNGTLFTPNASDPAGYNGSFTVASVTDANNFVVNISGTNLPSNQGAGAQCFLESRPASTTTGLYNKTYANTTFTNTPGRVGVDSAVTSGNNGIWNTGTPDLSIGMDTFSARWTGQVQPQFTEEYTFTVIADDGCTLWINGQLQPLKMFPSAISGGSTYTYNDSTGDLVVNYAASVTVANSFVVGEPVRIDPSGGALNHAPTTAPTYTFDPGTNSVTVDYTNLVVGSPGGTRVAGSYAVGETVELDPTSGGLSALSTLPYMITAIAGNTFTVDAGSLNFSPTIGISSIATGSPCTITTVQNHGLTTGNQIRISSVSTGTFSPAINDLYTVTVTSPTAFTVASNCTVAPVAGTGTMTASGSITVSDNRNAVVTAVHTTGTGSYNYVAGTGNALIDYSSLGLPANSIAAGQVLALDPTSGNLNGLPSAFATVIEPTTATTFTVSYGINAFASGTGTITIVGPAGAVGNPASTTGFTINIGAGRYAANSTSSINVELLNKALKDWSSNGNERFCRVPMVGGTRYDIQLDYYENGGASRCLLNWFSASQPKQIIPQERLYPATATQAPPTHTSATDAVALIGGPFSYAIQGSNGAAVSVSGNPAWLTYSNGVLSGTPPAGTTGLFQVLITLTNAAGTSTSLVNLEVKDTGGTIPRDSWSGVAGTTVASIPTSTAPTATTNLNSLQAPTDFGDNYGARIRGYITAPVTGNYYFWLAASNAAELWISNDDEPVNIFRRAWVTNGTAAQQWNAGGEPNQKSPWLALEQGKRYYIEILHKAGTGAGDNLAVGWSKPGESTAAPSEIVPGYVLSPYVVPAAGSTPGTLYFATMLAQAGATTNGVGKATLRVNEDETVAYINFSYSGLTNNNTLTDWHIHSDSYLGGPAEGILYDGVEPPPGDGPQPDGSHKWTIAASGSYNLAAVREIIKQGKAYINLHTAANPNGEIRGNFTLAAGTRTFTPPPAPPSWTDDSNTDAGAVRFLTQASFGANVNDIQALKNLTPDAGKTRYEKWIDNQFLVSPTPFLGEVLAREIADVFGPFDVRVVFDTWWKTSMTAPDQLRQKIAFALSQIHVVSGQGPLEDNSKAIAHFYDTLSANAFGNFKDVLIGTTLTPAMGRYLDMLRNDKPDLSVGRSPNENYAREIKQLFSIGLYRMWPDGTLMLTSQDTPIDTYTQREIVGLSHVFTGWEYGYDGAYRTGFSAVADWTRFMREVPVRHFTGPKRLLNNEVLPGLASVGGQPLDPYANHTSTQYNDAAYQALPVQELQAAHKMLFDHPNTGPFICRQLIQRMVTSHPSRDYLYRVVQKFNNNGSGVRGDMQAVIKAILLDYEARNSALVLGAAYGKQREPIQRVANAARAFRPTGFGGTYSQTGAYSTSSIPIITVNTNSAHLLSAGNSVFLEFTDTTNDPVKPAPTTATYSVVTAPTTTSLTVHAQGWIAGSYTQTAGASTITVNLTGHWLPAAGQAYFDFVTAATGTLPADGVRTVGTSNTTDTPSGVGNQQGTTFTITAPDTTARTGTVAIARFGGSYSSTGAGGVITIDTTSGFNVAGNFGGMADHHLAVGDQVFLNFTNSRDTTSFNETSTENDLVYTIVSVPDANTFTVMARNAPNAAINSDNQVVVFPLTRNGGTPPQPLVRSGTINARPSTYTMDNTDGDLNQTPLNSPTVFNYFLPDYKFSGTLAAQGLTTPEFQLTAETTTVRQNNFMYAGIFNPSSTTGIMSFKTGSNALVMDVSPWMVNADATVANSVASILGGGPQPAQVWTSNANVGTLIDRLNTLLLAGQLPAGAKTAILQFIGGPISSVTTGSPCTLSTSSAHGLEVGDQVTVTGITGGIWSGASSSGNGTFFVRTVPTTTTMTLGTAVTGGTTLNCTSTATLVLTNSNANPGTLGYTNATPSATNIRDRLRAILHLILTSPDFTIQR